VNSFEGELVQFVYYSRHNTVLDMWFDTALPSTMGHSSKFWYEVFLLPKHCYPSLPLVQSRFVFRFDRSEGRGRKVRNVQKYFVNVEIYFEMCKNVEICFLRSKFQNFVDEI